MSLKLQNRTNLTQRSWINLGSPTNATGAVIIVTDSPGADRQRFYRLVVLP
jgi:hypothetical protein